MSEFEKLINQMEARVRRAFLQAMQNLRNDAQIAVFIRAIEAGDIDQAVRILNIKAEYFDVLEDVLRQAYIEGGARAIAELPVIPDPFPQGAWFSGLTAGRRAPKDG